MSLGEMAHSVDSEPDSGGSVVLKVRRVAAVHLRLLRLLQLQQRFLQRKGFGFMMLNLEKFQK